MGGFSLFFFFLLPEKTAGNGWGNRKKGIVHRKFIGKMGGRSMSLACFRGDSASTNGSRQVKQGLQLVTGGLGGLGLVAAEELVALGAPGAEMSSNRMLYEMIIWSILWYLVAHPTY